MKQPNIDDPTLVEIITALAGVAVFFGSVKAISPWELGDWAFIKYLISFFLGLGAFWILRAGINLTNRGYRKSGWGSAARVVVVPGVIGFFALLSWPYLYDIAQENLGTIKAVPISTQLQTQTPMPHPMTRWSKG